MDDNHQNHGQPMSQDYSMHDHFEECNVGHEESADVFSMFGSIKQTP